MGNVSFVTTFGDDHQMKRLLAASCSQLGQESPRRYALPRSRAFGTSALVEAPFIGMVTGHRSCAPQRTTRHSVHPGSRTDKLLRAHGVRVITFSLFESKYHHREAV